MFGGNLNWREFELAGKLSTAQNLNREYLRIFEIRGYHTKCIHKM